MNKQITFSVLLILLSIVSYFVYTDIRATEYLKNAGIPYKDERTIAISINEQDTYIIDEKKFNSSELIKHLNKLTGEYGCDMPLVFKFGTNMMDKNLNPYLETICNTSFYKLFFSYKDEILSLNLPCPCMRINHFSIYIPQNKNDSEKKYKIISKLQDKEKITFEIDPITKDEFISILKQKPNASLGLVLNPEFMEIKSFLELLYICKQTGCKTLEIVCSTPEFEIQLREAKGKVTIPVTEEE